MAPIKKAGSADAGAIKRNQSTVTTPQKTGDLGSKTSTTLSGGKNFQFGGVTNSTLEASLKTPAKAGNASAKAGDPTAQAKDIEDSSVWQAATEKAGTLLDGLSTTLTNTANAVESVATSQTLLNSAQTNYNSATNLLNLANSMAANNNWTGAAIVLTEALAKIEAAEEDAKKAGNNDKNLTNNIEVQKNVIKAALNTATSNANNAASSTNAANTANTKGCSGGGCSGGGNAMPMAYMPANAMPWYNGLPGMANGLNDAFKAGSDLISSLFGGNKSGGASKASKTSELKYDKNSEAAKEIERDVKPDYDKAGQEIASANKTISDETKNAAAANEAIKNTNDKINKLGGARESLLQKYNSAKQKESEFDTNTAKQNAIVEKQTEVSKSCEAKLRTKNNAKVKVSEELTSAKADLKQGNDDLKTANDMPDEIQQGTDANGNPIMVKNSEKITAIANADAKIKAAKLKIQEKENELNSIEADIKDITNTKEAADKKVTAAKKELESINEKRKENDKLIKQYSDGLDKADKKAQELKAEVDANYKKLTDANSKIAQAKAQIDAGESRQKLAQNLANNIAKKATNGKLPWYDFQHGSLQEHV